VSESDEINVNSIYVLPMLDNPRMHRCQSTCYVGYLVPRFQFVTRILQRNDIMIVMMILLLVAVVGMGPFDTSVGRHANVFRQDDVSFPFATSLDRTSGRMVMIIGQVVAISVVVIVATAATFIATTTDAILVNVLACVGVIRSASLLMILLLMLLQLLLRRIGTCGCTTCGR